MSMTSIFAGKGEVGVAWGRSEGGDAYLSVSLDEPSFPAPVYANLIEEDGKHPLTCNR
jgi:uncharacterized protein (DUF736 family)